MGTLTPRAIAHAAWVTATCLVAGCGHVAKAPPHQLEASPARLLADVSAFPPYRNRSHLPAIGAMEDLVGDRLRGLGWEVRRQQVRRDAAPGAIGGGPVWRTHNLIATRGLAATGPVRVLGAHLSRAHAGEGILAQPDSEAEGGPSDGRRRDFERAQGPPGSEGTETDSEPAAELEERGEE